MSLKSKYQYYEDRVDSFLYRLREHSYSAVIVIGAVVFVLLLIVLF